MKLKEISPNTLPGSFSNDLIIRKLWAVEELEKISNKFHNVYVLGSWYGNMGFILDKASSIKYDSIINIDLDKKAIDTCKKVYKKAEINNSRCLVGDVNKLKYQTGGHPSLIINTSVNNIKGRDWFKNIPASSLVLLQCRTNDPGAINRYQTLSEFKASFPLKKLLYAGKITLSSDDESFDSFMIIGIK